MPETATQSPAWHPVRFSYVDQAPARRGPFRDFLAAIPVRFRRTGQQFASRGFLADFFDSTLFGRDSIDAQAMADWCRRHCRGTWRVENEAPGRITFWFEQSEDASAFALHWFPFRCS